jgi:hypothetical protein
MRGMGSGTCALTAGALGRDHLATRRCRAARSAGCRCAVEQGPIAAVSFCTNGGADVGLLALDDRMALSGGANPGGICSEEVLPGRATALDLGDGDLEVGGLIWCPARVEAQAVTCGDTSLGPASAVALDIGGMNDCGLVS